MGINFDARNLRNAGLAAVGLAVLAGCNMPRASSAEQLVDNGNDAFHMLNTVVSQKKEVETAIASSAKEVRIMLPESENFQMSTGRQMIYVTWAPKEALSAIDSNTIRLTKELDGAAKEVQSFFPTFNFDGQNLTKAAVAKWSVLSPVAADVSKELKITAKPDVSGTPAR